MRRVCRSPEKVPRELPECFQGRASDPGVLPMSHLRAKFQQTSGQRLTTSHHFPAQFQNFLARRAGTAGDHPNVQKCFNPVCVARPCPPSPGSPPASVSVSLARLGGPETNIERASWYLLPELSCEHRCPTIAFAK